MFPGYQHGQHQLPATTAPYASLNTQTMFPSANPQSRQNSDAMDIYNVTDRESVPRGHSGDRWSNNGSPTANSKNHSDHSPYEENGRLYHGFRRGIYMLPCDEQEQDRLDIFHKLFTEARVSDGLIYAPHPENGRFLDLGCGTGIWAIDIAHKYPNAHVVGVDLAPIQPSNRPKNCDFYAPWDFESHWSLGEDSWDLIHMQMGSGSVASWPSLYRRIFSHLRPGAWFEQVEIDFEPRCDDRSLEGSALRSWYQWLKQATEDTMRPISHSSRETIRNLQEAGFVEIDHQMVGLPLNPWHQDEHEKKVARWYNLAFSESVETISLASLCRVCNWPVDRVKSLAADVKSEAFNKEIHAYNILHIYQARKPIAN
ncbi:hypothetical protein DTO021D3_4818 [Paecilomyces variotii]|nr:hypothetical protein DTO032I3_2804 [Paecilomyces variotii]KAJ9278339.1 hypothetical protein DTO021D3_4818 [Paecilomyces variotii]KAJ9344517.1 hypothetical protein DTO027B6_3135 [Paecilomyces variotii]KAJ9382269.1 hypothetical protein DTO032I4_5756 [Paecilomyces variotii]